MNRRPGHLTEHEREILSCIRRSIEDSGEGLPARELARAVGMSSTSSVVYHLQNLEQRGALVREGRGWRSCRVA
ncbi:hypothetical protein AB0F77_41940 [Streptomyces sp. NPDC026672]|uniref:LexA family protein n=1 Tax=unclassified Streptomyces TaxID=2593676 RepID=UPI0033FC9B3B